MGSSNSSNSKDKDPEFNEVVPQPSRTEAPAEANPDAQMPAADGARPGPTAAPEAQDNFNFNFNN